MSEEVKNMKGTVKWFNLSKGYGFITGEDGKDTYVNKVDIPEGTQIRDGDQVEYQITETEKGTKAIDVKKLD
jgi:CspA family cold shock protein